MNHKHTQTLSSRYLSPSVLKAGRLSNDILENEGLTSTDVDWLGMRLEKTIITRRAQNAVFSLKNSFSNLNS